MLVKITNSLGEQQQYDIESHQLIMPVNPIHLPIIYLKKPDPLFDSDFIATLKIGSNLLEIPERNIKLDVYMFLYINDALDPDAPFLKMYVAGSHNEELNVS